MINETEKDKLALAVDLMISYGVSVDDCIAIIDIIQSITLSAMERNLRERLEISDSV
jgi:hypothetical protein